ncbi:helix-turn-helix domain-containing protein [Enterococcus raffinosus]|uniref:Helix-turn-helix domain-containing protein n=1 Tax=Enterococcus raffinosus TaxID=71452 RepID=A0AAW8TA92_9ENTE|nr:helix-turn-helix domain-containing protein [Enterococcus raffinosus]MDT2521713.1 helix-turn-helix domain-containing protein [Enterococcus raffinosus]MDT2531928.1 helix-turn-helix domain-containing protein [Enterococcus raffinosus]MDT2532772.1 helix-turn-helix domain-containing protein [Enterococcus raffinosus]MDT2545509.1 helix-turn-helix domain-containing protein [Enterococcus raffinosus]MDT2554651.1 helix-turn-helix domain-containing protein [Enterococcus raffinosus]
MKKFHQKFLINKTHIRWFNILDTLEHGGKASTICLSEKLSTTQRTIISDISAIRDFFGKSIEIHSTYIGYTFQRIDSKKYDDLKHSLLDGEPLFNLIVGLFLYEPKSLGEWSDILFLSESSFKRYLSIFSNILLEYDLTIATSPVEIVGDEFAIRKFFMTFFYEADITSYTINPNLEIQSAARQFLSIIKDRNISSISFTKFCYLIYISMERHKLGHNVFLPKELNKYKEVFMTKSLTNDLDTAIFNQFKIHLPENEISFIIFILISIRKNEFPHFEQDFISAFSNSEILELGNDYCAWQEIPSVDPRFVFIHSFFTRVYLFHQLTSSYNKNILDVNYYVETQHEQELKKTKSFLSNSKKFKDIFGTRYLFDISCSLTLFNESLVNLYVGSPKKIAFVLEGQQDIVMHTKSLIFRFLSRFQNLFFVDGSEFTEAFIQKNKIDIVVTNYPPYVENFNFSNVKVVLMNSLPTSEDWNNLLATINPAIIKNYSLKSDYSK